MKEYRSDRIRNLAIVSHGGAGKTSLTEALLFSVGAVNRLGRVDDGTATTDFEPEEVKRKMTISTSLAPCEWQENKINFLDTPGYSDFSGEIKGALRAVESSLVVVCAASGIEVDTEKVWNFSSELGLPRILFINKMDRENADFFGTVNALQDRFGKKILPLFIPIGSEESFSGVIDLLTQTAYSGQNSLPLPDDQVEQVEEWRQKMFETIAESDDALLNKYLEGQDLSLEEIKTALGNGIASRKIYPVLCGSAYKNIGVRQLLDFIISYAPSADTLSAIGMHPLTQEPEERTVTQPFSALIFKTTADPFVGRLSFIKVFSGSMKPDSTIYNISKDKSERISSLFTLRGKHQDTLPAVHAGDITVVAKLQETATGNTLAQKESPILYDPIEYPDSMFTMCVEAKNKGDEDKIGNALARIVDEDPTFRLKKNSETNQLLISGLGELHLEIMAEKIKRKFGVDVTLSAPKVPYRETIRTSVKIEGKHKKQTGGHGQFGHVWLQIDPLPAGGSFEFVDSIFGGAVPRQYIPAVEKGVKEAMSGGILAGYPLVDIKVTLFDGSYHTVDSSEMAFKIASSMAIRKGVLQAKPVLLEPVCSVEVNVPDNFMGDVIADLNSKRGRIQGMEPTGKGKGVIRAQVPMSEMARYAIDLRSITQGRGCYGLTFSHYEEMPQRMADNLIAATKKDRAEEA